MLELQSCQSGQQAGVDDIKMSTKPGRVKLSHICPYSPNMCSMKWLRAECGYSHEATQGGRLKCLNHRSAWQQSSEADRLLCDRRQQLDVTCQAARTQISASPPPPSTGAPPTARSKASGDKGEIQVDFTCNSSKWSRAAAVLGEQGPHGQSPGSSVCCASGMNFNERAGEAQRCTICIITELWVR